MKVKEIGKDDSAVCVCKVLIKVNTDGIVRDHSQSVGFTYSRYDKRFQEEVKKTMYAIWSKKTKADAELKKKLNIKEHSKIRIYTSFQKLLCHRIIKVTPRYK